MLSLIMTATLNLQPVEPPVVDWQKMGEETLASAKARETRTGQAKNVILFIADGMDITTISAGRIHDGQNRGEPGEENILAFETLPYTGLSKTYTTNMQTPDSAGTATAMLTGHKTKSGVINVDQTVPRGDCSASLGKELTSILDIVAASGRHAGVISTARLTHATPATLYAQSADRNWEADSDLPEGADACSDIASQLIATAEKHPLQVAFGGGRTNFLPAGAKDPEYPDKSGKRTDGRNLLAEWKEISRRNGYVWNREGFEALDPKSKGQILGLFEPSHMQYEADRSSDAGGEPSIAEMTGFAIDKLSRNKEGYFLLVEGGRVDHAHHAGNAARALTDLIAFDDAVETAIAKTDPEDTLIIVTADHGHTLVFQGYPQRGNPILGLVRSTDRSGAPGTTLMPASDGKPFTTLAYGNGPGSPFTRPPEEGQQIERPFVTEEETVALDYKQQAVIPGFSETHGGQDVPIYATGPQAHLLTGVVEQNFIYYVMKEALTADE